MIYLALVHNVLNAFISITWAKGRGQGAGNLSSNRYARIQNIMHGAVKIIGAYIVIKTLLLPVGRAGVGARGGTD